MQLVDFRAALRAGIAADSRFTGVEVSIHGGDFDKDELLQYAKNPPSVIVHVLRADMESQGGHPVAEVTCAAIVLAEDKAASPRDVQALNLVDALLRLLQTWPGPTWNLNTGSIGAPTDIVARNLYARELDAKGVAMWCVAWRQQLELIEPTDTSVNLNVVHLDWEDPT